MILIINSAGLNLEEYRVKRHARELPLASSIIVSGLRKHGYKVAHVDMRNMVSPYLKEPLTMNDFNTYIENDIKTMPMQDYISKAFSSLPNLEHIKLIGMSVFSHINYIYALTLASEIHKLYPNIPICFGGAFINLKNPPVPSYVDFYIRGTGIVPISHIASHFINKTALDESLRGLWFNKDGNLIGNGINEEPADMEDIPDFSDLNLERYLFENSDTSKKYLKVPYRASIGCPRNCTFCTTRLVDTKFQYKSIEKVVSEVKSLNNLYENVLIRFTDAAINNSSKMIKQILDKFIQENFYFNWRAFAKMHDMDEEVLKKAAQTGCQSLVWGIENASPNLIDFFDKGFDINFAKDILNKASSLNIKSVVYLIFNAPGETEEDLDLNESFIRKLCYDKNITFDLFEFLLEEGSLIFQNPQKYGIEILDRNQKGDFTIREDIKWKELNMNYDEFKQKQKHHTTRKIEMMNYCRLETGLS